MYALYRDEPVSFKRILIGLFWRFRTRHEPYLITITLLVSHALFITILASNWPSLWLKLASYFVWSLVCPSANYIGKHVHLNWSIRSWKAVVRRAQNHWNTRHSHSLKNNEGVFESRRDRQNYSKTIFIVWIGGEYSRVNHIEKLLSVNGETL